MPLSDPQTTRDKDEPPLLTPVPAAARTLGASHATAYRLAVTGELPSRRPGRRIYAITTASHALGRQP